MKPCDQSKSTTTSLEKNPLERLSTEDWYRFIDIFAMLKIKRPREKEQHRNHRIDCLSKLWRSQYGHARPGYGLQVEISEDNLALIARSIRGAIAFVSEPKDKECPESFIVSEEHFTDQSSNPRLQAQQIDFSGSEFVKLSPENMELNRNMPLEELEYCITLRCQFPEYAGPAISRPPGEYE
ncbi:hypothetical protein CFIO01_04576 [Colletotrichum fioriniae PJ7]|uniref:Uncharacterized protein n=1 Tax=Colletotrichum fioriniae PJ7 TaxID=1445577 RepID=A0A010RTM2_9PEZI|nr:hypothetical protein CFIO01_04576 [Colletotrichum fioriniae PJ7]